MLYSPAEVKLAAQTLEQRLVADVPERLIGDKAYDSDALDKQMLNQFGAEVIAPHREGRRSDRITQDGRSLRRFQRRWKVERLFAWLYNFRRLVVRCPEFSGAGCHGLGPGCPRSETEGGCHEPNRRGDKAVAQA